MVSPPEEPARDVDEFSRAVAEAYFPHEVTPRGRGEVSPTTATLKTLDLGPVLIGYVGWGTDVQVECDYPSAYEINIPLAGHLESRGRHGTVTSTTRHATVFRADTPTLISHWDANCTFSVSSSTAAGSTAKPNVSSVERSPVSVVCSPINSDSIVVQQATGAGWSPTLPRT